MTEINRKTIKRKAILAILAHVCDFKYPEDLEKHHKLDGILKKLTVDDLSALFDMFNNGE